MSGFEMTYYFTRLILVFSGVGQQWQSLFDWWYKCCNLSQCWRVFQHIGLDTPSTSAFASTTVQRYLSFTRPASSGSVLTTMLRASQSWTKPFYLL